MISPEPRSFVDDSASSPSTTRSSPRDNSRNRNRARDKGHDRNHENGEHFGGVLQRRQKQPIVRMLKSKFFGIESAGGCSAGNQANRSESMDLQLKRIKVHSEILGLNLEDGQGNQSLFSPVNCDGQQEEPRRFSFTGKY